MLRAATSGFLHSNPLRGFSSRHAVYGIRKKIDPFSTDDDQKVISGFFRQSLLLGIQ
jgi:hypothetical protein